MPTYQYTCGDCGENLEVVQKFTDDALTVCPSCQGSLRKVFNAVGIVFKGSGFYRNDSRDSSNGKSGAAASNGGQKSGGSSSENGSSGSDGSSSSGSESSGAASSGSGSSSSGGSDSSGGSGSGSSTKTTTSAA